jgi:hypothetical protein
MIISHFKGLKRIILSRARARHRHRNRFPVNRSPAEDPPDGLMMFLLIAVSWCTPSSTCGDDDDYDDDYEHEHEHENDQQMITTIEHLCMKIHRVRQAPRVLAAVQ